MKEGFPQSRVGFITSLEASLPRFPFVFLPVETMYDGTPHATVLFSSYYPSLLATSVQKRNQHRCKCAHVCRGGRIEWVWAYAQQYVTTFDTWLWECTSHNTFLTTSEIRPGILDCPPRNTESNPSVR